ncbi:MAG: aminoacyl-tRNA hydrolase [Holosporaceae bacterium]
MTEKQPQWLIVGLGNPGARYARHRHNVGFQLLDVLHQRYHFEPFADKARYAFVRGTMPLSLERQTPTAKVILMKPLTFMNLSGPPVGEVMRFYKIPPDNVLVVHDELALKLGQVRLKKGGSAGGHNGLKSLDQAIGQGYGRLRLGIDHPGDKEAVTGYVLGNFTNAEDASLKPLLQHIADLIPLVLQKETGLFSTKLALLQQAS